MTLRATNLNLIGVSLWVGLKVVNHSDRFIKLLMAKKNLYNVTLHLIGEIPVYIVPWTEHLRIGLTDDNF